MARKPPRSTEERLARWQRSMTPGTLGGRVASAAPMALDTTRLDPRLRTIHPPTGGGFDPNADPVVIGLSASATGTTVGVVAIGSHTTSTAGSTVAIGLRAEVDSTQGIAIGPDAYIPTSANASVAIGSQASANAIQCVAVGYAAFTATDLATAVGGQAVVTSAAPNGTAIGYSSTAQHDHGVAIGANARTRRAGNIMLGRNSAGYQLHLAMNDDDAIYLMDNADGVIRTLRISSGAVVIT